MLILLNNIFDKFKINTITFSLSSQQINIQSLQNFDNMYPTISIIIQMIESSISHLTHRIHIFEEKTSTFHLFGPQISPSQLRAR